MPRDLRVLVMSPLPAVRAGLASQASDDSALSVVGLISGAAELSAGLESARPDVVLGDPSPGDLPILVDALAEKGVAMALVTDEPTAAETLLSSDVPGWALLPRHADSAEIAVACRAAAEGMIAFGRGSLPPGLAVTRGGDLPLADDGEELLTPREREVLQLLAGGLPNKVIAARLSVSLHTIKFHVASILSKLGVESRTEAVTAGVKRGLVTI